MRRRRARGRPSGDVDGRHPAPGSPTPREQELTTWSACTRASDRPCGVAGRCSARGYAGVQPSSTGARSAHGAQAPRSWLRCLLYFRAGTRRRRRTRLVRVVRGSGAARGRLGELHFELLALPDWTSAARARRRRRRPAAGTRHAPVGQSRQARALVHRRLLREHSGEHARFARHPPAPLYETGHRRYSRISRRSANARSHPAASSTHCSQRGA